MERGAGRALDPLAVPAAVGHAVVEEPLGDSRDIRPEPRAVGEGVGVDAAVDLAAPVRQVVVLPATVCGEQVGGTGERGGVEAPVAQGVERPRRRGPRLASVIGRLGAVEVEVAREVCPAGPLPVGILQCEQPGPETLPGDSGTSRLPHLLRRAREVAFDLPAQRRVRVEQPGEQCRVDHHDRQATRRLKATPHI